MAKNPDVSLCPKLCSAAAMSPGGNCLLQGFPWQQQEQDEHPQAVDDRSASLAVPAVKVSAASHNASPANSSQGFGLRLLCCHHR